MVARQLVVPGKGILAADESTPTRGEPFARCGRPQHGATTPGLPGAPVQRPRDRAVPERGDSLGRDAAPNSHRRDSFVEVLRVQGIVPGVKVDKGTVPLAGSPGERVTQGLDGLRERLVAYVAMGAVFAKWRAAIVVGAAVTEATLRHL
jgi:fructose-bisphosphate aldolase class I